jgi:transcriptional regulator with XRE-family HTH domain
LIRKSNISVSFDTCQEFFVDFSYHLIYYVSKDTFSFYNFAHLRRKEANMTIGENIRRIRNERGMTLKQLGDAIGVSESYIRAYEAGRRNPKQESLEALAKALNVEVEALSGKEYSDMAAMQSLFKIARLYNGFPHIYTDQYGNEHCAIDFTNLLSTFSWAERYEEYMNELEQCDAITDRKEKAEAILKVESAYLKWMDTYPEEEKDPSRINIQRSSEDIAGLMPDIFPEYHHEAQKKSEE